METIQSFKGYGKVDEAEERGFRKRTRRRIMIMIISTLVLLAVIVGVVVGIVHKRNSNGSTDSTPQTELTPSASLKAVCSVTQYPDSCYTSISSLETHNTTNPEILFKLSLQVAMNELVKLKDYPAKLISNTNDKALQAALTVCQVVIEDAVDTLNDTISSMAVGGSQNLLTTSKIDDIKTWLSATITDQETCFDALQEMNATLVLGQVKAAMKNSTEYVSNSLAIVTKIVSLLSDFDIPIHWKLLGVHSHWEDSDFPSWVSVGDRRLLQESNPTPDFTVAADGSGDYTTISEAVKHIPKRNTSRFVIHVKEGLYVESVNLDRSVWNVMIYGDGTDKTVVSGNLNFVDGTATFFTATFAVDGKGFIAKKIKFANTAGAEKHQAVAFRSGSDMSVYYQCAFDGFQDTLYTHSNRQFYRECQITGTIDFIFGNSAVVFQNCQIQPRNPLSLQFDTITAQGKQDMNQNTGISIQKSTISALDNITSRVYLGRPWKNYSTTIFMQSSIDMMLDPAGWISWVSGVDPPDTIYYAEYQNSGPGSNVTQRANWAGYRSNLTDAEVSKFSVENFIQGNEWLKDSGVTFDSSP